VEEKSQSKKYPEGKENYQSLLLLSSRELSQTWQYKGKQTQKKYGGFRARDRFHSKFLQKAEETLVKGAAGPFPPDAETPVAITYPGPGRIGFQKHLFIEHPVTPQAF